MNSHKRQWVFGKQPFINIKYVVDWPCPKLLPLRRGALQNKNNNAVLDYTLVYITVPSPGISPHSELGAMGKSFLSL